MVLILLGNLALSLKFKVVSRKIGLRFSANMIRINFLLLST